MRCSVRGYLLGVLDKYGGCSGQIHSRSASSFQNCSQASFRPEVQPCRGECYSRPNSNYSRPLRVPRRRGRTSSVKLRDFRRRAGLDVHDTHHSLATISLSHAMASSLRDVARSYVGGPPGEDMVAADDWRIVDSRHRLAEASRHASCR